ncbi:MAG: hypothetical protein KAW90_00785 [Dehalococcoidales bacterium]|nr:hypothetical protein [Dehalococcoidales bacterium]
MFLNCPVLFNYLPALIEVFPPGRPARPLVGLKGQLGIYGQHPGYFGLGRGRPQQFSVRYVTGGITILAAYYAMSKEGKFDNPGIDILFMDMVMFILLMKKVNNTLKYIYQEK